jgi:hypothetical protein
MFGVPTIVLPSKEGVVTAAMDKEMPLCLPGEGARAVTPKGKIHHFPVL